MTILKKIRDGIAGKAQKNLSLAIYSILIAILAWFVIAMTMYPSVPKTIRDVELSLDISGSNAANNGLSVVDCDVKKVSVKIKGSRTQIGKINASSISAYIDAENVSSSGRKTLAIKIRNESNSKFEIESVYPETAVVEFDKFDTRSFPVKPLTPNIKFADGKTIYPNEFVCEPDSVNITGPSAMLDKIAECYAVSNKSLTLDSSYALPSDEIQLFSEDGAKVLSTSLKFSATNFTISIPVLAQKDVDLSVSLINAPSDFDKEWFLERIKFSTGDEKITVASKNAQAEIPNPLEIGKISLPEVDIDPAYSHAFPITTVLESSNMINLSDLDEVTATFDDSGLVKKEFVVDHTKIIPSNAPESSKYDYSVVTKTLRFTAIGPEEVMEDLNSSDFVADVNLLNAKNLSDQFSYDVTIMCLKSNRVWSPTKTKIILQRTERSEATTVPSDDE